MASDRGLVSATACAVVGKLNSGEVTPLDLLDALEQRIAEVDGKVNALPTLCFDRARARAEALMKKPAGERGLLAGLPVPIKDLTDVEGVLTTHGSPIYKDRIPARSDLLVEHLEDSGGVIYAKSNTPEFGAGANTFNEVFGATRNPWDTSRSAAGSSGGAAVALATGMAWLAHGSDTGGSLRNPASFCGIVGLRPSIGRVAHTPAAKVDRNLSVQGPMARRLRHHQGRAFANQARPAQARGDLEYRGRPQADGGRTRARRSAAGCDDRAALEFLSNYDLLLTPCHDRDAVSGGEPVCRRMRREKIR